jgi:hypothetical protein
MKDLKRSQFRQTLGSGFVQRQLTLLHKLHRGCRRYCLRHGSNGENRVGSDWHAGDRVTGTERSAVHRGVGSPGRGRDGRDLAAVQPGTQNGVDPVRWEKILALAPYGKRNSGQCSTRQPEHT